MKSERPQFLKRGPEAPAAWFFDPVLYHEAFFVWTLPALGTTAIFSVILSARGLRSLRKRRQHS